MTAHDFEMSRLPQNTNAVKATLRAELETARRETDALFSIVHRTAMYERPIEERHRIIFYLGHLEVFDWNLICATSFGMKPLHKEFEHLFAFGIDPVDGKLPHDKPSDWPTIEVIRRYNDQVRQAVDQSLEKADLSHGQIFSVAIEHRQMHLETLSYMLHWLPFESKKPAAPSLADLQPRPANRQTRVSAGRATLGMRRSPDSPFGWDNEFETQTVDVPEFAIDVFKVSNGEFMEFVEAGGYTEPSLWKEEDWNWIRTNNIRHPKFWTQRGNEWRYRAMFAEIPLPQSWPVYVSHAEASAYARWRGKSLPTEAQFHRAAFGDIDARSAYGNYGFKRWDPVAVNLNDRAVSPHGAIEMVGNGWEWTSSVFAPFPGFERFPFYPGYSADFFDNKHFVLKGASPRTATRLTRTTFRNWFQPHYPYIYAGFRCVEQHDCRGGL